MKGYATAKEFFLWAVLVKVPIIRQIVLWQNKWMKKRLVLFLLIPLVISFACTSNKDLTPLEQHKIAADKLATTYIELYNQYRFLEKELPSESLPKLKKAAKTMNTLRYTLSSYLHLVKSESVSDTEKAQLRKKIQDLISDVTKKFILLSQKYDKEQDL